MDLEPQPDLHPGHLLPRGRRLGGLPADPQPRDGWLAARWRSRGRAAVLPEVAAGAAGAGLPRLRLLRARRTPASGWRLLVRTYWPALLVMGGVAGAYAVYSLLEVQSAVHRREGPRTLLQLVWNMAGAAVVGALGGPWRWEWHAGRRPGRTPPTWWCWAPRGGRGARRLQPSSERRAPAGRGCCWSATSACRSCWSPPAGPRSSAPRSGWPTGSRPTSSVCSRCASGWPSPRSWALGSRASHVRRCRVRHAGPARLPVGPPDLGGRRRRPGGPVRPGLLDDVRRDVARAQRQPRLPAHARPRPAPSGHHHAGRRPASRSPCFPGASSPRTRCGSAGWCACSAVRSSTRRRARSWPWSPRNGELHQALGRSLRRGQARTEPELRLAGPVATGPDPAHRPDPRPRLVGPHRLPLNEQRTTSMVTPRRDRRPRPRLRRARQPVRARVRRVRVGRRSPAWRPTPGCASTPWRWGRWRKDPACEPHVAPDPGRGTAARPDLPGAGHAARRRCARRGRHPRRVLGRRLHRARGLGRLVARLDVGVAIFFVLSGFLLSRPWLAGPAPGAAPAPAPLPVEAVPADRARCTSSSRRLALRSSTTTPAVVRAAG